MSSGDLDENRSDSSTDHAGSSAATAEAAAPAAPSTDSTPSSSPVPETAPPAASGSTAAGPTKPAPTAPDDDPVQAAIERLARDDSRPRDDKGRFALPDKAAPKPPTAKPAAAKAPDPKPAPTAAAPAKPEKPATTSPTGVDTDPYHGFDEREAAALKGKTRQRIEELHQRWATTAKELEALKGKAPEPDEFAKLISTHHLDEDVGFVPAEHLAGLVKTQAAVNRAFMALQQQRQPHPNDLTAIQGFLGRVDSLRGRLGFQAPAAAEPAIKPLEGKLPDQLQELIDVYGLPENDVRLLAALKGRGAAPTTPAVQTPAPAAPAAPQTYAQPRGVGVDMEAVYGQRLVAELTRGGVKPEMVKAHYQVLMPTAKAITQERFPGVAGDNIPAVFDALPPRERYDILAEANRRHQANARPLSRPPTPPPPATPPSHNGSIPRAKAASTGDPVIDAVSFLARPG